MPKSTTRKKTRNERKEVRRRVQAGDIIIWEKRLWFVRSTSATEYRLIHAYNDGSKSRPRYNLDEKTWKDVAKLHIEATAEVVQSFGD